MDEPRYVFDTLIEGLFVKALGAKLSAGARKRMREAGVDIDKKLLPAYEYERFAKCLDIAAEHIYGGKTPEAYRHMGERFIDGFKETFLGGALFKFASVFGVNKGLKRTNK